MAQARASFERVLSLSEGENVHALLGLATLELNAWREQVHLIESEARKHPTGGSAAQSAHLQKSMKLLEDAQHVERALQHLRDAYAIDPHNCAALLLLSAHHFYRGDLTVARDFAQRALAQCDAKPQLSTAETRATALYHLARTYHVQADQAADRDLSSEAYQAYELAYASYEQAKTLLPRSPVICLGYAQMLQKRGETERAIENLETVAAGVKAAIAASPDAKQAAAAAASNFDVLRLLGSLYASQPSKSALQSRASTHAGSKDKSAPPHLQILLPDYEKSYHYLQRSIDLHPNSLELLLEFAEVAMQRHVYAQAYLSYKRCLKLLTDLYKFPPADIHAGLLNNLGVACHQMQKVAALTETPVAGAADAKAAAQAAKQKEQEYLAEAHKYYTWCLDNKARQAGGENKEDSMEIDGAASAASAAAASSRMSADTVTTHYNMALLSESAGAVDAALAKMASIVAQWPAYTDALLYSASVHQRHANYPKAWALLQQAATVAAKGTNELLPVLQCQMGNWHMEQGEPEAASKCFDAILSRSSGSGGGDKKRDDYAKVELGNSTMQRAHRKMRMLLVSTPQLNAALNAHLTSNGAPLQLAPALDAKLKDARSRFADAAAFFLNVLNKDPRNVYASQGLACVLAEQGKLSEAKEIFQQVKEITGAVAGGAGKDATRDELDLPDVWCNLGHIFVQQGSYVAAVKHYLHCLRSFRAPGSSAVAAAASTATTRSLTTVQVLTYLARAYYLSDAMQDAKRTLLKALHLAPTSTTLWFNLGLVSEAYAIEVFQKAPAARSFREVESAILELTNAFSIYTRLAAPPAAAGPGAAAAAAATKADHALFGDLVDKASKHAVFCRYSIEHGQPHLAFARQREEEQARLREESRETKAKLEEQMRAKAEEATRAAEAERARLEEEARAKKKHLEDISATWETVVSEENTKKSGRGGGGGGGGGGGSGGADDDEGMGISGEAAEADIARRKEKVKNRSSTKKAKRERDSGSDEDGETKVERPKKKKKEKKKGRSKYQEAEVSDDDGQRSDKEVTVKQEKKRKSRLQKGAK